MEQLGEGLRSGRVAGGREQSWTIADRLAVGGTALITEVVGKDGRKGVVKTLSDHRFEIDDALLERYQREIRAFQKIDHPNVLPVWDLIDLEGQEAPVFERAESSLHQTLEAAGRVGTDFALLALQMAAKGLAALHDAGLVHRDVTPKNLLIMSDGRLCVGDLGTVRELEDETITRSGHHLGSLIYISPQQAADPHSALPADDVFSLGQVGYLLLTGKRPQGNPPPLVEVRWELPAEVTSAVESMRLDDRRRRPRDGLAAAALLNLSPGTWTQVAVGLVERREFATALRAMKAGLRLRGPEFEGDDLYALELLSRKVGERIDVTLTFRLARWAAENVPSEVTTRFRGWTEREWNEELLGGRHLGRRPKLPAGPGLRTAMSEQWTAFRRLVNSTHDTGSWLKVAPQWEEPQSPLGLGNLGLPVVRDAMIVVESLLSMSWATAADEEVGELVSLLPSRWCKPYDFLDETLVAVAVADDSASRFRANLRRDSEGRALWQRWESWIRGSCSCQVLGSLEPGFLTNRTRPQMQANPDCPLLRLISAAEPAVDIVAWSELWWAHEELRAIEYAADAADVGLSLAVRS